MLVPLNDNYVIMLSVTFFSFFYWLHIFLFSHNKKPRLLRTPKNNILNTSSRILNFCFFQCLFGEREREKGGKWFHCKLFSETIIKFQNISWRT